METKANRARGGLAQLGEHLPCKQGVESSNLLVSIAAVYKSVNGCRTYLENRILKIYQDQDIKKKDIRGLYRSRKP